MINKKITMSMLSIVTALTLTGGATYAFFSDTASSTGNTFGAGNLNLQIANPVGGFAENVTATFNVTDLVPGQTRARTMSFNNNGTTPIVEIAMGLTAGTPVDAGLPSDVRNVLNFTILAGGSTVGDTCTGGTDVTAAIASVRGDNNFPLTMNEMNGFTYDSLPISLPTTGSTGAVCVQVAMDNSATDAYQGDTVNADFIFTAHQNTSQ